ncbi:MAG: PEP-CTERM sorting domain-containing protein [Gemmatimonadaceae bacterium]|nr:PEP-CTERM sorting domain-containing protein [Gemmatimonadaceae bacterium]
MRPSPLSRAIGAVVLLAVSSSAASGQWANTGLIAAASDPIWSVRWRGINGAMVTPGFAPNAATMSGIPSVWNPNASDTRWIGATASGSVPVSGGSGTARVEYLFQTTLTAATDQVAGRLGWDNLFLGAFIGGTIDANGALVGGTRVLDAFIAQPGQGLFGFCRDGDGFLPGSSYPNCTMPFIISGLAVGQQTTITFVLNGDGGTDGLFLTGATALVPEPAPALLLITGLGGLLLVVRKRRLS